MTAKIIDELFTVIGIKKSKDSDKDAARVQKQISSLRKQALLAGAAFAGAGIALEKIVSGVDQQAKFARGIGLSFENLRKFQFAAQKAGASAAELNGFVGNLAKTITSLNPGQFNRTLQRLGVRARDEAGKIRPLEQVLLDVAQALQGFSKIKQLQLVSELGGSINLANFLTQDIEKIKQDLQEAVTSGFVIPERLTGEFAEFFDDSLLKLRGTVRGFTEVLIGSLLPTLRNVVDELDEWILKNKELLAGNITDFLKGAAAGFSVLNKSIMFALDTISSAVSPLGEINEGLSSAKVFGFAAATAMGALAVTAAIAARQWLVLAAAIATVTNVVPKVDSFIGKIPFLNSASVSKNLERLKELRQLEKPLTFEEFENFARTGVPTTVAAPVASNTINNAGSQQSTITQNNVFNISGAQNPKEVANQVREALDLPQALQTASPGFNRPKVG